MRYVISLGIPVLLLVLGAIGRWVMAGGAWQPEFGCLGPDLLLGSLGAETAFLAAVGKRLLGPAPSTPMPVDLGRRVIYCTFSLVLTFIFLVSSWLAHRSPPAARQGGRRPAPAWTVWRRLWLQGFWNAMGLAALVLFLALIQTD